MEFGSVQTTGRRDRRYGDFHRRSKWFRGDHWARGNGRLGSGPDLENSPLSLGGKNPPKTEQGSVKNANCPMPLSMARGVMNWEDRAEYWHIHDADCGTVAEALAGIEQQVLALLDRFALEEE